MDNAYLSSILNYRQLEGKTIPLRLGLQNATFIGIAQKIDVFSVTDLSGSMDDNCGGCNELTCTPLAQCNDADGCKICDAKSANFLLVDYILNTTGNRVGLVGYDTIANPQDFHPLSNNSVSLKSIVSSWDANGYTCICCGMESALDGFLAARENRLFLFYDFNDNVKDYSGIGYRGNLINSPTYVPALEGKGIKFNGINQSLEARNVRVGSEGTIAFWMKLDNDFSSSSSRTQGIWGKYRDNSNNAFIALKGSDMSGGGGGVGTIQVKMERGGSTTYVATTTDYWQKDRWYHLSLIHI